MKGQEVIKTIVPVAAGVATPFLLRHYVTPDDPTGQVPMAGLETLGAYGSMSSIVSLAVGGIATGLGLYGMMKRAPGFLGKADNQKMLVEYGIATLSTSIALSFMTGADTTSVVVGQSFAQPQRQFIPPPPQQHFTPQPQPQMMRTVSVSQGNRQTAEGGVF